VATIELTDVERNDLQIRARTGSDAREVRRAQSLLWLAQGEAVGEVAERLGISRQTVYNWVERYRDQRGRGLTIQLADGERPGRPAEKRRAIESVIEVLLNSDPRDRGYSSAVWSSEMLRREVEKQAGVKLSGKTMRRVLRGRGYRYKRPRHVLSRRSPTWRQAKGGSSGVSRDENGR
jgi:transposase